MCYLYIYMLVLFTFLQVIEIYFIQTWMSGSKKKCRINSGFTTVLVIIFSKATSPCQNNMCSLPQILSPLKVVCFQTSLARSHLQQPVPATVQTSTAPSSKLLKRSLKGALSDLFISYLSAIY